MRRKKEFKNAGKVYKEFETSLFIVVYSAGITFFFSEPTGIRPKFSEKLADHGISLPADIFGVVDVMALVRK